MEEILARHRKEQRDLQARVTQKKKNATKKTRKGVNDECNTLERELEERQNAELKASNLESVTAEMEQLEVNDHSVETSNEEKECSEVAKETVDTEKEVKDEPDIKISIASGQRSQNPPKRPNRQKARLARRAAEQEAQAVQAAEEAADLPDLREQEMTTMQQHLATHGLREISIRPDGHCLYSAVATVLPAGKFSTMATDMKPYQVIRTSTASFISDHADDFVAFLEEPLETYVGKIKDTAEWGGQLELQAIARAYAVQINVLQADGRVEKIEPEANSGEDPVWLAYYRHSYGLGEHYNALTKTS
jgi:OTU domain-containing protein 6